MKIEGSYSIPGPRDKVWALLQNPSVLQGAIPGCDELKPEGDGLFRTKLCAGLAAIRGNVEGEIRLQDVRAPEHYRLSVSGKGMGSFVNGWANLDLVEAQGGTEVRYEGEVSVGGMIVAVGNRMIEVAVRKALTDFFDRIKEQASGSRL